MAINHYELVVTQSKRLEGLLDRLGGRGKGLHERVTSLQRRLPEPLVKRLRFIATVRNQLVHDPQVTRIDDAEGYQEACEAAAKELQAMLKPATPPWSPMLLTVLLVLITTAILAALVWIFR